MQFFFCECFAYIILFFNSGLNLVFLLFLDFLVDQYNLPIFDLGHLRKSLSDEFQAFISTLYQFFLRFVSLKKVLDIHS